jgi:DNA polymerase (family 10)
MKNFEVARLFNHMADVLELRQENVFRIRAYRRAAQSLESLHEDVETLDREARLDDIPGVGADLAGKIAEYLKTGHMRDIERAARRVPAGVVALMNVPGIGPKMAMRLHRRGITDVDRLEKAARAGLLRGLPGIQAKTEQGILRGIALVRSGQARMPLGRALPIGRAIVASLRRTRGVKEIALAGSIRRGRETVGDIDVLVTSDHPRVVMDAFVALADVAEVLEKGSTKGSIRHREGIQVDLRVMEPAAFGAALVYFTGSKQHNIRIRDMALRKHLKISEYGVFRESNGKRVAGATEEEVYAAVGLPWIPPELREDAGEVEAALDGRLPALVTLDDVRGDLHCHTKASDGHVTIEALVGAARRRGYEYVVVSDHSRSARVAGGLSIPELRAHAAKVRAVGRTSRGIRVLAGTECDILPDGSMDYPGDVLGKLDLVVAAVHARFKQPRAEMTRRLCRALENPHVDVLAHPSGRLLGERDAYEFDLERVLDTAKRHDKAIEINAYPTRLDLNDVQARRAHERGVLLAIDTDAHLLDHLAAMELGVLTARRAWVVPAGVVNTSSATHDDSRCGGSANCAPASRDRSPRPPLLRRGEARDLRRGLRRARTRARGARAPVSRARHAGEPDPAHRGHGGLPAGPTPRGDAALLRARNERLEPVPRHRRPRLGRRVPERSHDHHDLGRDVLVRGLEEIEVVARPEDGITAPPRDLGTLPANPLGDVLLEAPQVGGCLHDLGGEPGEHDEGRHGRLPFLGLCPTMR